MSCPKCGGHVTTLHTLGGAFPLCLRCNYRGEALPKVPEQIQADYNAAVAQREEMRARDKR